MGICYSTIYAEEDNDYRSSQDSLEIYNINNERKINNRNINSKALEELNSLKTTEYDSLHMTEIIETLNKIKSVHSILESDKIVQEAKLKETNKVLSETEKIKEKCARLLYYEQYKHTDEYSRAKLVFSKKSLKIMIENIEKEHFTFVQQKLIDIQKIYINWEIQKIECKQYGEYNIKFTFDIGRSNIIICVT